MAESHGVGGVTWSSLRVLDESDVVESPGCGRVGRGQVLIMEPAKQAPIIKTRFGEKDCDIRLD